MSFKTAVFSAMLLICSITLSACFKFFPAQEAQQNTYEPPVLQLESSSSSYSDENHSGSSTGIAPLPQSKNYVQTISREIALRISAGKTTEAEKARAVFEYIIENTYFADPVGLDMWIIRGDRQQKSITYEENRALSPLVFGIGSCEDYACALVVLLREMGIEARYMPGLTYSVDGIFVDHAWTIAKIDGKWYHLDSQLEDNVMRSDTLRYRYFLKSDDTMFATHRWGQNLIDCGLLSSAQNSEISELWLGEPCEQDYPTPEPKIMPAEHIPPVTEILRIIESERREYEAKNGKIGPYWLNTTPPVFNGYPFP